MSSRSGFGLGKDLKILIKEGIMANDYGKPKKKPVGKLILYGILSTALYAAMFGSQGTIMAYFTRGSWYAALPIATAFLISFVHGGFTGHFWSVLGIEATRKSLKPRPEVVRPDRRERPQPQPRLRARV
jgi:hypothetical protein